jgi:hypothetical protein
MGQYAKARRESTRPLVPAAQWTPQFVAVMQQHMDALLQLDVLPSTAQTYNNNVQRYGQYCTVAGLPFQPDLAQVQQFIICMVTANYKLSTIAVIACP